MLEHVRSRGSTPQKASDVGADQPRYSARTATISTHDAVHEAGRREFLRQPSGSTRGPRSALRFQAGAAEWRPRALNDLTVDASWPSSRCRLQFDTKIGCTDFARRQRDEPALRDRRYRRRRGTTHTSRWTPLPPCELEIAPEARMKIAMIGPRTIDKPGDITRSRSSPRSGLGRQPAAEFNSRRKFQSVFRRADSKVTRAVDATARVSPGRNKLTYAVVASDRRRGPRKMVKAHSYERRLRRQTSRCGRRCLLFRLCSRARPPSRRRANDQALDPALEIRVPRP